MDTLELLGKWEGYLSRGRARGYDDPKDKIRSPFHKDYDRILFSPAFRRLQDKTQVYPLAQNDNVRRRLTHSLEVASIGRCLGRRTAEILRANNCLPTNVDMDAMGLVVAAACLAHDIGNPPFGHAGEKAVGKWFKNKENIEKLRSTSSDQITDNELNDFQNFDGNAQGFRILTSLQDIPSYGGMRLTAATLASFVKYPSILPIQKPSTKFGVFQSEIDEFGRIASSCKLERKAEPQTWQRHPLNYLMEAADDICYLCADTEDAYHMELFSFQETKELLEDMAYGYKKSRFDKMNDQAKISYLVASAIGNLIEEVSNVFEINFEALTIGQRDTPLINSIKSFDCTERIRQRLKEDVFKSTHMAKIEVMGFEIITYFLDQLVPSVIDQQKSERDPFCERFLRIISELPNVEDTLYYRLLRVTDFISGMTDSYALKLYQELRGIRQPIFAA